MKIAHVTPVYPPYKAGMGHTAYDYVEFLKSQGDEVVVFTPQYTGLKFSEGVVAERGIIFGKAAVLPQLLWHLRGFDVIHLHYPFYGAAFFTALAALIWKKRLIVTYHMKTQGSGWLGRFFTIHRSLIEPIILRLTESVLVSSVDYAESIGLHRSNLIAMPFGVDEVRFSPGDRKLVRQKLHLDEKSFIFIFVGALDDAHYFKGVDILLEAAAKVRDSHPWKLLIVGGGNREIQLQTMAKKLEIADKVIFAGSVSPADLPDYYRSANVHVLPSIDRSEAYGLVTLEAAGCGLPSFVSALPGVRTLVIHKETGLHLPVNNADGLSLAMQWALTHQEKTLELGKNARKMVEEKYGKIVCARRLQALYKGGKLN